MSEAISERGCGQDGPAQLIRPATLNRLAVISMHTSPTAVLGRSANGGLNVYVRQTCLALSRSGIACDVFTRDLAGRSRVEIEPFADLARVIYLPAGNPNLDKYDLLSQVPEFADRVAEFAATVGDGYDLIHSHYWLSGAAACRLRSPLGAYWAHTAHTLGIVKNRHLARGAEPEPQMRIELEKEITRSADLLIASTETERADLIDLHGARPSQVEVVAPGVDLEVFRSQSKPAARAILGLGDGQVILFVGRLERLKGVDIVLRAFADQARSRENLTLVVVGDDSREAAENEKSRLIRLASDLDISGRVRFEGSVPQTQLPLYYSSADVCMMPSYSESFGLVALEAQACGCPVVASDVAGLASVVRHRVTGFLVAGDDPADYSERLGEVLDSPELISDFGRRAAAMAGGYTWERTAARIQSLLARPMSTERIMDRLGGY